jgi:hypothetical protein
LADGVSTAPLEIWGERHTMYIAYTYCYEKKKKKKLMQPLYIEPVTSLVKCRVALL